MLAPSRLIGEHFGAFTIKFNFISKLLYNQKTVSSWSSPRLRICLFGDVFLDALGGILESILYI